MKSYVFLFALFLAGSVFAFSSTVPEETIFVSAGESRQIEIPFLSNADEDISLTLLDAKPWMTQSDSIINMDPGIGKVLTIYMSPPIEAAVSVPYKITLVAQSLRTGEEQKKSIYIRVNKLEAVDVEKMTLTGNFTPNGNVILNAVVKNYRPRIAESVNVFTTVNSPSGKMLEFEQLVESIDSGETSNLNYNFALPRYAEAGLYTVTMRVTEAGESKEKTRSFSVARQASFVKDTVKMPNLFGFRMAITMTNVGNQPDDATVTETISSLDAAFYSGDEPASKTGNSYTWIVRGIGSGESKTLYYTVNYFPALLFVAVVLIASWVFFFRLRVLRIKKYILEKKYIEQGEEFTVGIELMNMSGKAVETAVVKDFVPSVFEIKDAEGPKPTRRKISAGTELTWHVKDLHKNEERILSYKIIPVFGIHGSIRLPRTSVKYHAGKKEVETKSLYANIGIEMDSYKDKNKRQNK
jgi:hypothetical protein